MKIIIKGSTQPRELSIVDPESGVNYISDFVGNTGATNDGQFEYCDESDAFICDQDTYEWWSAIVDEYQTLDYLIAELKDNGQSDFVFDCLSDQALAVDFENYPAALTQLLNQTTAIAA